MPTATKRNVAVKVWRTSTTFCNIVVDIAIVYTLLYQLRQRTITCIDQEMKVSFFITACYEKLKSDIVLIINIVNAHL